MHCSVLERGNKDEVADHRSAPNSRSYASQLYTQNSWSQHSATHWKPRRKFSVRSRYDLDQIGVSWIILISGTKGKILDMSKAMFLKEYIFFSFRTKRFASLARCFLPCFESSSKSGSLWTASAPSYIGYCMPSPRSSWWLHPTPQVILDTHIPSPQVILDGCTSSLVIANGCTLAIFASSFGPDSIVLAAFYIKIKIKNTIGDGGSTAL